jgi:hypothetical protein
VAFDEGLAERIRDAMSEQPGISERKMFGGLCYPGTYGSPMSRQSR